MITQTERKATPVVEPKTIGDENALAIWDPVRKRSKQDQRGVESIARAVAIMTGMFREETP